MSDSEKDSRLPPPAFPPGTRRRLNYKPPTSAESGDSQAYISPDDPLPDRSRTSALGPAFISPDDPIPERKIELLEEFRDDAPASDEEGVVVGMDLDAHLDPSEMMDPHVMEVIAVVEQLASALRARGEAALRGSDERAALETTLRACCASYLAGRRAEDIPVIEEPLPTDG